MNQEQQSKPIGVYKEYQLFQLGGKFTKDQKQLVRERAVITHEFAERHNREWKDSGKIFEFDEAATAKYYEDSHAYNVKKREALELKNAGGAAELLTNITKAAAVLADSDVSAPKKSGRKKQDESNENQPE